MTGAHLSRPVPMPALPEPPAQRRPPGGTAALCPDEPRPAADKSLPITLPGWPAGTPPPRVAAVMQPYFLPYPGYFALMQHVDVYILDDLAQYTDHGWMNRNRIQKPGGGWQYVTVPVKRHAERTPICAVEIAAQPWQQVFWGRLSVYARAPGYREVCALLRPLLEQPGPSLAALNEAVLRAVCARLGIRTPVYTLSRLALPGYRPPYPKGQNALAVCRALGGIEEYRNPPGGAAFYPRAPYAQAGVRLVFEQWRGRPYPCGKNAWQPRLSVLDALMYLPPEEIRRRLEEVERFA